jgi:signal transduction histidine kinase
MVCARAFAIGLSDYSYPAMVARTIVLPADRQNPAQDPASPVLRRGGSSAVNVGAGTGCGNRAYHILLRGRRAGKLSETFGGLPVPATIEREAAPVGYGTLLQGDKRTSRDFTVSSSVDSNDQPDTRSSGNDGRVEERLAALEYLRAVRPGVDHVLQELVDEVRGVYGTDLCMVNLNLSNVQYFRAWSGELDPDLAEARQDDLDHSMCKYVVNAEVPLIVEDFLATEEFREQHWCVNYGIRFYAGTPLITSAGQAIGTLCLLSTRSVEFGEEQIRVLGAFARAVVGRLELLGALEREQAAREEEAQRSQELQQTLDSLSAHIAILDEAGGIIAVNGMWRAFAEANGGDPGRVSESANYLRACESAKGLNAEEAAAFAEGIRDVLSGRRENFEMEYPCHSPTERRWFIGRVTPYFYNEKSWAVVAHENITERKLAEEALQDQKVLLETILGQAADAIIVCDDEGRFTFANAAARHMALQNPNGTTLETTPEVWGVAHYPDGRRIPREEWSISRALRGETTVGREVRMARPDGSHYDVLISAAPLNNADGDLVGAVASLLDITENKRAEEERGRLRQQEIEARTQSEERRRIARDLHDVVLQDLAGALQSLRLTHLQAEGSGMEFDLEEELEALTRATSGLRSAMYDLRHEKERPFLKSVESLVELNRQLTPQSKTTLIIDESFPKKLPHGVSVELLRVLQEALINARRHSGARNVAVRLRTEGEALVAAVIDDGRGFDPASTRTGVGLSAMHERVEGLGGKIEVKGPPGEGTRVTVRVPLGDGTPAPRRL